MNTRFTRLDMAATVFLFAGYTLLMTAFCTIATGRQEVQGTICLLMGILGVTYLGFEGMRISSPRFSLLAGAILGILLWVVPVSYSMITEGDDPSVFALVTLFSLLVVVLPTSLLAAAFAWIERGRRVRLKWVSRVIVLVLLLGATGMAGFMGWDAWDMYSPGQYGQNVEFRVLAQIGKDGLTEEMMAQSPGIESPPTGYIWLPSEGAKLDDTAVRMQHDGQLYVLLHNAPPWVMTHKADAAPWAIKSVEVKERPLNQKPLSRTSTNHDPADAAQAEKLRIFLVMRLDYRGAEQLEALTEQCVRDSGVTEYRNLGMVIGGKLEHSAAVMDVLYAFFTRYVEIGIGTASTQDTEDLQALRTRAKELCKEMRY